MDILERHLLGGREILWRETTGRAYIQGEWETRRNSLGEEQLESRGKGFLWGTCHLLTYHKCHNRETQMLMDKDRKHTCMNKDTHMLTHAHIHTCR